MAIFSLFSALHIAKNLTFPLGIIASQNVFASFTHQPKIECQVVDGSNFQCQQLVGHKQMTQISLRIHTVHFGSAIGLNGRKVLGPLQVAEVQTTMFGV